MTDIICGDNLQALTRLVNLGAKFDLVEIDGPYSAGSIGEAWDDLGVEEYLAHYAARLALVRQLLQPWGVVFMFGYPEGCAEVSAWCRQNDVLYLRRWLTWHKRKTVHKGRKIETILFFVKNDPNKVAKEFGAFIKAERERRGWTLAHVGKLAGRPWWHRGGNLYYETGSGGLPSLDDYMILAKIFDFSPSAWPNVIQTSYEGITDIDLINSYYREDTTQLGVKAGSDSGLRSKPVGLYLDLFKAIDPPTENNRRALVLYGGSGSAGVAALALGYQVTICESDPGRCSALYDRLADAERYAGMIQPNPKQMVLKL